MESTRGGMPWEVITDLHTLSSHTPVDIGWEGDNQIFHKYKVPPCIRERNSRRREGEKLNRAVVMEEDRPSVAGMSPPLKLMLNLYSTSDSISLTIWTVLETTPSVSLTSYTLLSNWKETAEQEEQREEKGKETSVIYTYRKKQDRQRSGKKGEREKVTNYHR